MLVTKCCQADYEIQGKTTMHFECKKCGEPCDLIETEDTEEDDDEH